MARNGYLARRAQHIQEVTNKTTKEATNLMIWLAVVALNNEFGFGEERAQRFMNELQRMAEEHDAACKDDYDLATERLRVRLEKILRCKVMRVD